MTQTKHFAILLKNTSNAKEIIRRLLGNNPPSEFEALKDKKGMLFSRSEIERYMDEEERHDIKILTKNTKQSLKSMSSGEQKKALLKYLMGEHPDFLILVNPFDNLDVNSQSELLESLKAIAQSKILVQILSRTDDLLPIPTDFFKLEGYQLIAYPSPELFWKDNKKNTFSFSQAIPKHLEQLVLDDSELVRFRNVSVSFDGRQVLNGIDWTIKQGEFWQLIGPNGSGKTTLLSMITGDNHKGYGQDLTLFGRKKGSGESVWDLKEHIGYFTPAMMDKFRGYHTATHMIISGLHDSIGLYLQPSDTEKKLALQWLELIDLASKKEELFKNLSQGEKRLVMTARAMIKHPPLLILDEPTAGLDDNSAAFFVALVNKIAQESNMALIYVSHRKEPGLHPQLVYELHMGEKGSTGHVKITDSA